MSNAESAGFIVAESQDGSIIWGIGFTEAGAWLDAQAQAAGCSIDMNGCTAYPASAKLLAEVELGGGALEWTLLDGVAVHWSERSPC